MKATRPTEAECQRTIVAAAKAAGWLVHAERPAQRADGRWMTAIQGDPGFPDLVLVHPGRGHLAFVELKRKPYKSTPQQVRWYNALDSAGARVSTLFVPEQMPEFLRWLTDANDRNVA